jgi:hypothetical protein
VSFSRELFHKELIKSVNWVESPKDLNELRGWCDENFGEMYPEILNEVFSTVAA